MPTDYNGFKPSLAKMPLYGKLALVGDKGHSKEKPWNREWPTIPQIMQHNLGRITKLKKIVYKNGTGHHALTGIGLEFTGGLKSPIFTNREG